MKEKIYEAAPATFDEDLTRPFASEPLPKRTSRPWGEAFSDAMLKTIFDELREKQPGRAAPTTEVAERVTIEEPPAPPTKIYVENYGKPKKKSWVRRFFGFLLDCFGKSR